MGQGNGYFINVLTSSTDVGDPKAVSAQRIQGRERNSSKRTQSAYRAGVGEDDEDDECSADEAEDEKEDAEDEASSAQKARKLCTLLSILEDKLAHPWPIQAVGRAYRNLGCWTWKRQWDSDMPEVVRLIGQERGYPTWRRQALDEAYRLFFEEIAKEGNATLLRHVPEPPTSAEIGFRRLPEALMNHRAQGAIYSNVYEENYCGYNRKWQYDVCLTYPDREGQLPAHGRKIVPGGMTERACIAQVDPWNKLVKLLPMDCCSRTAKVQERAVASRPRRSAGQRRSLQNLHQSPGRVHV